MTLSRAGAIALRRLILHGVSVRLAIHVARLVTDKLTSCGVEKHQLVPDVDCNPNNRTTVSLEASHWPVRKACALAADNNLPRGRSDMGPYTYYLIRVRLVTCL